MRNQKKGLGSCDSSSLFLLEFKLFIYSIERRMQVGMARGLDVLCVFIVHAIPRGGNVGLNLQVHLDDLTAGHLFTIAYPMFKNISYLTSFSFIEEETEIPEKA